MEKSIYLGIDSGKHATKVAAYIPETDEVKTFSFQTRVSEGYLEDDQPGEATHIAKVEDKVYKVGNCAKVEAELDTSKMSEIHKICTQVAIAMCAGTDLTKVHVAIGAPVKIFESYPKRAEYGKYILPEGKQTVEVKLKGDSPIEKKQYIIESSAVYPESGGLLYLDPVRFKNASTAIIDIGNLNVNGTFWNGFDLDSEYSFTGELGGSILINNLAQELSANFGRCDSRLVAKILKRGVKDLEMRKLVSNRSTTDNPNLALEEESKKFITNYLMEHTRQIKQMCNAKHWSLDFLDNICFMGGTTTLLSNEIKEVFGPAVTIIDDPTYANAKGFLARLVANELDIFINEKFTSEKAA